MCNHDKRECVDYVAGIWICQTCGETIIKEPSVEKGKAREFWVDPTESDESEDCDVRQYDAFNDDLLPMTRLH